MRRRGKIHRDGRDRSDEEKMFLSLQSL